MGKSNDPISEVDQIQKLVSLLAGFAARRVNSVDASNVRAGEAMNRINMSENFRTMVSGFYQADEAYSSEAETVDEKNRLETKAAVGEYSQEIESLKRSRDRRIREESNERDSIKAEIKKKRERIKDLCEGIVSSLAEAGLPQMLNLSEDAQSANSHIAFSIQELELLQSHIESSVDVVGREIQNYRSWRATHAKVRFWSAAMVLGACVVVIFIGRNEYIVRHIYANGKVLHDVQQYGPAVEELVKLEYSKSVFKGNEYFQRAKPMICEGYYQIAKEHMRREKWKEAQAASLQVQGIDQNYKDISELLVHIDGQIQMLARTPNHPSTGNAVIRNSSSDSRGTPDITRIQEDTRGLMQFLGPHEKQMLFKQPAISSGLVGLLIREAAFTILEHSPDGEWAKISVGDSTIGWIKLHFTNEQGVREAIRIKQARGNEP